ncbi:MAG: efflux RND transporter permease subunit [Planctomycetes bacterium]|nr:efflux RND transporter permease subunit [Planctomycetota bacterium]
MASPLERLVASFVRNPVFANLLALGSIVGGAVAVLRLPRETFPETATDHVLITVPYPGASPEDVERGVNIKIEQAIEGIPGLGEVSSLATEDSGKVLAAFDPSITPAAEVLRQVQDRVNTIRTFPPEAQRPVVTETFVPNPVVNIGVHGPAPEMTIKRVAEQVRNDLLADPKISQVALAGVRDYEIAIQVREETLQQYELTLREVIDAISRSSLDLPAGTVRTRAEEINVRTTGQRYTKHDFEDLVVIARPDGSSVRLGQIAQIRDTFEETPLYGRIDGEPGATVTVAKTAKEDISDIAHLVRRYVEVAQAKLPEGIRLSVLADKSRDVDQRLQMLVGNGLMGMALLMICLMLFMDFRAAVGVAMGVPVATAGALWVLHFTGQTLNMISLFGLILADAIVLDDSIVIAENVLATEKQGLTPELAAIKGTASVGMPVLNASLTTIVMFMPLMYVQGVMGKLIYVLPVAVIATIVASGLEAFFILPPHLNEWATVGGSERARRSRFTQWRIRTRKRLNALIEGAITRVYAPVIRRLARNRLVVLGASAALIFLCIGLVWGGRTPFVLFPQVDRNTLKARVRFPEGTPVEVSQAAVQRLEAAAGALNDDVALKPAQPGVLVQHIYSTVGEWADFVPKRGSGLCETSIELMPAEQRRVDCARVIEAWRRNVGAIAGAVSFTITREVLGPTEKPVEIRLLSEDLEQLRQATDELEARLADYAGVFDIEDDLIPGKREMHVSLQPGAANLGLSVSDLAAQLRQGLYGGEAVRLQRGRDEVKVVVSYQESDRRSLSSIDNLRIRTRTGAAVPFHEVAETRMVRGYSAITRQDGLRRVRIHADVDERHANAEQIVHNMISSYLPELCARHPGLIYRVDGERARISESLSSLIDATVIALAITYAILGAALRSYVQPLILMAAIPLGMAGAVLGHTVMGYDLSLMSVFGMTALAGIVVNDALVLLDQVNQNVRAGMEVQTAVTKAAEARVLAVFLTALTNVAGLAPMLFDRSTQAQPLIPIAISVAFGLTFSTVLTTLIVPSLYLVVNDLKRFVHWLRHGGAYPLPEEVERAGHQHAAAV